MAKGVDAYIASERPVMPVAAVIGWTTELTVLFGEWWDESRVEFIVELGSIDIRSWLGGGFTISTPTQALHQHGTGFVAVFDGDRIVAIEPVGAMDRVRMFLRAVEHGLTRRMSGVSPMTLRV